MSDIKKLVTLDVLRGVHIGEGKERRFVRPTRHQVTPAIAQDIERASKERHGDKLNVIRVSEDTISPQPATEAVPTADVPLAELHDEKAKKK